MAQFFISYKTGEINNETGEEYKDHKFVYEELKKQLDDNDFDYWIDAHGLTGGDIWNDIIDEEIEKATALILVISERSMISQFVTYEWCYALFKGIKIIPIKIQENKKDKEDVYQIHNKLHDVQMLEFIDESNYQWSELFGALNKSITEYTPPYTPMVLNALEKAESTSPKDRIEALETLKAIEGDGREDAINALAQLLTHDHPQNHWNAYFALVQKTRDTDERAVPFYTKNRVERLSGNQLIVKAGYDYKNPKHLPGEIRMIVQYKIPEGIEILLDTLDSSREILFHTEPDTQYINLLDNLNRIHTPEIRVKLMGFRNAVRIGSTPLQKRPNYEKLYGILNDWDNPTDP